MTWVQYNKSFKDFKKAGLNQPGTEVKIVQEVVKVEVVEPIPDFTKIFCESVGIDESELETKELNFIKLMRTRWENKNLVTTSKKKEFTYVLGDVPTNGVIDSKKEESISPDAIVLKYQPPK